MIVRFVRPLYSSGYTAVRKTHAIRRVSSSRSLPMFAVRTALRQAIRARCVGTVGTVELEELIRDGSAVLIDVRSEGEIAASGALSLDALCIPLDEVLGGALLMDDNDFEEAYGAKKPALGDKIVFSCAAGVRSAHAAGASEATGFTNTFNYLGGAKEWFSTPR